MPRRRCRRSRGVRATLAILDAAGDVVVMRQAVVMRVLGPVTLVLTAVLLVAVALATGEQGYCRMIHLVAKPVGLGALALWALLWTRRHDPAQWRPAAKLAWIGLFVAVFALHAWGAFTQAPAFCTQPVCAEATGPDGWLACLRSRWS